MQHNLSKETSHLPELIVLYDIEGKSVVFASEPPEKFFGTPVHISETFSLPAQKVKNDTAFNASWHSCLHLRNKERCQCELHLSTVEGAAVFQFTATGVELADRGKIIHFAIRKTMPEANVAQPADPYIEFVDIASHDLDAPLRKLNVHIETLQQKLEKGEMDAIKVYLPRIQRTIGTMRSLVDSLSTLSRTANTIGTQTDFDTAALISEVRDELKTIVDEKQASIECISLPALHGDREQFRLLFKNVLENALLFSDPERKPVITIDSSILNNEEKKSAGLNDSVNYIMIRIADNGIGIKPSDMKKIFQPFVRLHGKSEFPGNGIGLAICKKIIENHQGMLYAEENNGKGARIQFILPQIHN